MRKHLTTLITDFLGFKTLDGLKLVADKEGDSFLPYLDKESKTIHIPGNCLSLLLLNSIQDYQNFLTLFYASKMLAMNEYDLSRKLIKGLKKGITSIKDIPEEILIKVRTQLTMLLYREVGQYQMSMNDKLKSEMLELADNVCAVLYEEIQDESIVTKTNEEIRGQALSAVKNISAIDLELEEKDYEELEQQYTNTMENFSIRDTGYSNLLSDNSSIRDEISKDFYAIDKMLSTVYPTEESIVQIADIWMEFLLHRIIIEFLNSNTITDNSGDFSFCFGFDSVRVDISNLLLQNVLDQTYNIEWNFDYHTISTKSSQIMGILVKSFFEIEEWEDIIDVLEMSQYKEIDAGRKGAVTHLFYNCAKALCSSIVPVNGIK